MRTIRIKHVGDVHDERYPVWGNSIPVYEQWFKHKEGYVTICYRDLFGDKVKRIDGKWVLA